MINFNVLFLKDSTKKDKKICDLCGKKFDPNSNKNFYLYPTINKIVPFKEEFEESAGIS